MSRIRMIQPGLPGVRITNRRQGSSEPTYIPAGSAPPAPPAGVNFAPPPSRAVRHQQNRLALEQAQTATLKTVQEQQGLRKQADQPIMDRREIIRLERLARGGATVQQAVGGTPTTAAGIENSLNRDMANILLRNARGTPAAPPPAGPVAPAPAPAPQPDIQQQYSALPPTAKQQIDGVLASGLPDDQKAKLVQQIMFTDAGAAIRQETAGIQNRMNTVQGGGVNLPPINPAMPGAGAQGNQLRSMGFTPQYQPIVPARQAADQQLQGQAHQESLDRLRQLNDFARGGQRPDWFKTERASIPVNPQAPTAENLTRIQAELADRRTAEGLGMPYAEYVKQKQVLDHEAAKLKATQDMAAGANASKENIAKTAADAAKYSARTKANAETTSAAIRAGGQVEATKAAGEANVEAVKAGRGKWTPPKKPLKIAPRTPSDVMAPQPGTKLNPADQNHRRAAAFFKRAAEAEAGDEWGNLTHEQQDDIAMQLAREYGGWEQ